MHLLTRLLYGDVAVSKELALDAERIHDDLVRFFATYKTKQRILDRLVRGESVTLHLHTLEEALQEELATIGDSERAEIEVLKDLKYLSKEHYLKQLDALIAQLHAAERQDEAARTILSELHDTLLSEARKLKRILAGDTRRTTELTDLLVIERRLVEHLSDLDQYENLFKRLAIGVSRHHAIEAAESRLVERMTDLVRNVELGSDGKLHSTNGHYISELAARVCNALEDAVLEAVEDGAIERHPHVDEEFVAGHWLDALIHREIENDRATGRVVPSTRTIEAFTGAFRQFYKLRVLA